MDTIKQGIADIQQLPSDETTGRVRKKKMAWQMYRQAISKSLLFSAPARGARALYRRRRAARPMPAKANKLSELGSGIPGVTASDKILKLSLIHI